MLWLFTQIWGWLLVAFALGAAVSWVVLSLARRDRSERVPAPPDRFADDEALDFDEGRHYEDHGRHADPSNRSGQEFAGGRLPRQSMRCWPEDPVDPGDFDDTDRAEAGRGGGGDGRHAPERAGWPSEEADPEWPDDGDWPQAGHRPRRGG
jgi:hypothetical protein